MRFLAVEVDIGGLAGFGQDGLAVGEAGQGGGVEAGEGVEGVALDAGPRHGGIEEAQIEAAVMADQDRPLAAVGFQRFAQTTEDFRQRVLFSDGHAQRVIELDPGEVQRRLFDIGPDEGLDPEEMGVVRVEKTLLVHGDGGGGDFQQGIGGAVEAAGLDIHNHRQVAAKTCGHGVARAGGAAFQFVVVQIFAHAFSSSRRQRRVSPARSRITRCSPSGRLAGAVQSSRTRVMVSRLRGRP